MQLKTSSIAYSHCVFNHILIDSDLNDLSKLAFISIDAKARQTYNYTGIRSALCSMKELSTELNCSKSTVYTIRKELITKKYLIINNKNELIPTVPDKVFAKLCLEKKIYNNKVEYTAGDNKLIYLDKSKMFIKINHQLLKDITANKDINTFEKILWLHSFKHSYCAHQQGRRGMFSTTRTSLSKIFQKPMSQICNSLNKLKDCGFLSGMIHKTISNQDESRGQAVNMLKLTVSLPEDNMSQLLENQANRKTSIIKTGQTIINTGKVIIKSGQNRTDTIINKNNILKNITKAAAPVDNSNSDTGIISSGEVIENNNFKTAIEKTAASKNPKVNSLSAALQKLANEVQARHKLKINNADQSKAQLQTIDVEPCNQPQNTKERSTAFSDLPETLKPYIKTLVFAPCMDIKEELQEILFRLAIKNLTPEQIDLTERYAYKLHTQKVAQGAAAQLSLSVLKQQMLYHVASWRPTKSSEPVKTALHFAWGAISDGSWKTPQGFEMHKTLSRELENHIQKKKDYGVEGQEYANLREELNKRVGVTLTNFLYNRWED